MNIISIAILCLLFTLNCKSQAVVKHNDNGKVYYTFATPELRDSAKNIGEILRIKNADYPIYKSTKGKFFIVRTSKQGNTYKQYITLPKGIAPKGIAQRHCPKGIAQKALPKSTKPN